MVPAEFMTTAVAMFTDGLPEFPYFGDKLFTCHPFKGGVHSIVPAQQQVQRLILRVWMTQPPNVRVDRPPRSEATRVPASDACGRSGPTRGWATRAGH